MSANPATIEVRGCNFCLHWKLWSFSRRIYVTSLFFVRYLFLAKWQIKFLLDKNVFSCMKVDFSSVPGCLDYWMNVWPFYNNENLPNCIKICKVGSKFAHSNKEFAKVGSNIWQNNKWTLKKWPKFLKSFHRCFVNSGHTDNQLC